jgi:hypothetical protein
LIRRLTEDHLGKDGKVVATIEKITITDNVQLAGSWFKEEILSALDGTAIDWAD